MNARDIIDDPQIWLYQNKPQLYQILARKHALAMSIENKPCTDPGCDEENDCPVHTDISGQVEEILRSQQ